MVLWLCLERATRIHPLVNVPRMTARSACAIIGGPRRSLRQTGHDRSARAMGRLLPCEVNKGLTTEFGASPARSGLLVWGVRPLLPH